MDLPYGCRLRLSIADMYVGSQTITEKEALAKLVAAPMPLNRDMLIRKRLDNLANPKSEHPGM